MKSIYMSPKEASQILEVSVSTVYLWITKKIYFNYKKRGSKYLLPTRQVMKYNRNGFPANPKPIAELVDREE